jgi:hypothetical protein
MQDIITLYTPELLKAFVTLTAIFFGANILQAIAAINRRGRLTEAEDGRDHAISMYKKCLEDVNTWIGDYVCAENEALKWKKTAKEVEADRDGYKDALKEAFEDRDRTMELCREMLSEADSLRAERATLYFRNAKGQIEPITPHKPKPHTLKHGMTVKDPSAYQAKRIFAAARRAGIDTHQNATNDTNCIWLYAKKGSEALVHSWTGESNEYHISAREFLRRIKGEIE